MALSLSREGERGFAVLAVLWAFVPLSLLFTMMASSSRSDAQLAANLRSAAVSEAAADGALASAVLDLLQGKKITGAKAEPLGGLVNPNLASAELLSALLQRAGASTREADDLGVAIVDWRSPGDRMGRGQSKQATYRAAGLTYGPPNAPFKTLTELQRVRGMTSHLWLAMKPHLSLYANTDPDPGLADRVVRSALADVAAVTTVYASGQPYRLSIPTQPGTRSASARLAVVRIGPTDDGRGWQILYWGDRSDDD